MCSRNMDLLLAVRGISYVLMHVISLKLGGTAFAGLSINIQSFWCGLLFTYSKQIVEYAHCIFLLFSLANNIIWGLFLSAIRNFHFLWEAQFPEGPCRVGLGCIRGLGRAKQIHVDQTVQVGFPPSNLSLVLPKQPLHFLVLSSFYIY